MTFRVREIVWDHGIAQTSTLLRPIFSGRGAAVDHIRLLQKNFDAKGLDQAQQVWWARKIGETPIHRWMIEETVNIGSRPGGLRG